jgi:hypothetical protein
MAARAWLGCLLGVAVASALGCGDGGGAGPFDAPSAGDAPLGVDGALADAAPADANAAVPRPGFGAIGGDCGLLSDEVLASPAPLLLRGTLDFGRDRYDDPRERPQLTDGGQIIVASPNEGGSSIFSETFAFEILARCELAELVKLETDIVYDVVGDKTDILVGVGGERVGVSVTRAMTFPFGEPYDPAAATELVERKLAGILESSANVSAGDAWQKQVLMVLAYDAQHAEVFAEAWAAVVPALQADTVVMIFETAGDDLFIYTDE